DINVTVRGDMLDGVVFENQIIHLEAGESKLVDVNFTIPANLAPGRHETQILVAELPPPHQQAGLAAVVAVVGQIRVFAPYPDKYAELSGLDIVDTSIGQKAVFKADFKNYGSQEIQSIAGTLEISDVYTNEKIASVPIDIEQNVPTGDSAILYAEWDTTNAKAGTYHVATNVLYDGIAANQISTNFRVGDKTVKIVNISSGQTTIADVKSPTATLSPWSGAQLVAYIDTTNVLPGTYDLKTILHYEDKTTENNTQINITKKTGNGIAGVNVPPEQLAILALVALIIVFGLLIARKKRKGRQQQYWPRYG
ncbi:MAG: hypothetical protein NTY99_01980, partial [DPANN group archaeon]|nr:hypothetical protein [DPANN group archaeon]